MTAVEKSIRLVNEDLLREAGYMLPQSANEMCIRDSSKVSCLALFRIAFTRKALFCPSGTACSRTHAWR